MSDKNNMNEEKPAISQTFSLFVEIKCFSEILMQVHYAQESIDAFPKCLSSFSANCGGVPNVCHGNLALCLTAVECMHF